MELTPEQREKIVEELNNPSEVEPEGNTSIFTMGSMEELQPFLKELTPLNMFEQSVALNHTSLSNLSHILPQLSKKNLIKLFFATLKLPEEGSTLKFGGTEDDLRNCEMAYANAQLARNALVHVLGTTSIAQARLVKKREQEAAQAEQSEIKEGENNEE